MSENLLSKIQSDISILQKDVSHINNFVDKLESSIDKLTELFSNISKLLAVYEKRLEHAEKISEKIIEMKERQRNEIDLKIKDIYNEMSSLENKLLSELKMFRNENIECSNATNERISIIEKKIAIFVGSTLIIGYILSKINLENIFRAFSS